MIDWMNDKIYKFSFSCVSHLFKLERTNTDIHTISWVSYSVGHKICFQILNEATLKTCFVPKQNHLILLCYWTHHVIHEINTLAFSSNSKTRFIFTFILYLYWFTDCCLLHLTWVTTLIVGLCGHLHPLPTKTWPPQLRMRCWTRRCFQY